MRIYAPEDERDSFVVVLTELPGNPGMSVTNAAEEIAAGVVLANVLLTSRTVFVEHYEDGTRGTPDDPATFDHRYHRFLDGAPGLTTEMLGSARQHISRNPRGHTCFSVIAVRTVRRVSWHPLLSRRLL